LLKTAGRKTDRVSWRPHGAAFPNQFSSPPARHPRRRFATRSAAHRYSPAAVVAVSRQVISGDPEQISTSFAERGNLSLRMACRRFTRLTNGFSKKLDCHVAAVALYVAHYNFCRVHETLRTTPAVAIIDSQSAKGTQKGGLGLILRATTRARRSRVASG